MDENLNPGMMPEQPMMGEVPQEPVERETPMAAFIESVNLAEKLTEDELLAIGDEAKRGYDSDCASREDWCKMVDEWTKLAKQTVEPRNWPWPNSSNVKYPLLSTAAMQFAARAYPSLLPSDGRVVKAKVIGKDPDGTKTKTAEAVSIYMSYQLMDEMAGWEEDMDKLLIMLPIVGTVFKKTYWDSIKEVNCSKLILPKNLVVDYWAKSLAEAERISEELEINPRVMKERQNAKQWLDVDLGGASTEEATRGVENGNTPASADDTTPYIFIEQHTYLDLDKDDYKEPYIVTFHRSTGKVVRIVARYDDKSIKLSEDGDIIRIEPIQYYTKFGFVPNPDGSFYDIGFGVLLGPLNESVNTLINQLVDAGTLNNLQGGFIGKGLRLKMGASQFGPGEWKVVNATGDDLKKQIVPLPSKEPSKVLFELMGSLISSGKELASVAEIFVGKMPGQNTPATTTMATIEQGMKVFTAVYKRIYRSLAEEFQKLYRLNGLYLNPQTYVDVVDMEVGPADFDNTDHKIFPGADPTAISQTEKLMKAQGLGEMMQAGMPLDPVKVMIRMLEAQEQPNWQELIPKQIMESGQMPPPPPDPKVQALQQKAQADAAAGQQEMQIRQHEAELNSRAVEQDMQSKAAEAAIKQRAMEQKASLDLNTTLQRDNVKTVAAAVSHRQKMQQSQESHQEKLAQQRQQKAATPAKKGPTKS